MAGTIASSIAQTDIWTEPSLYREGEESASIVVAINMSAAPVMVSYRTIPGTAQPEADYVTREGSIRFEPGEIRKTAVIPLVNDAVFEQEERFEIELFDAVGGTIATLRTPVIIVDNDRGHSLSGGPLLSRCPEEGPCEVTIYRGPDYGETSVELYFTAVTAVAGVDFVDEAHLVRFAPGQTVATVPIRIINNRTEDNAREFVARLRNSVGAPSAGQGRIGIQDNETGYGLVQNPAGYFSANEDGTFTLARNGDYDVESVATVVLAAAGPEYWIENRATSGVDFTSEPIEVRFAPFQRRATVQLPINNDTEWEPNEGLAIRFTTSLRNAELRQEVIHLEDNEVNPLHVERLCLPGRRLARQMAVGRDGKLLAALAEGTNSLLMRLQEDGSEDTSFTARLVEGRISKLTFGRDSSIFVVSEGANSARLLKVRADGTSDETFAEFSRERIMAVEPGLEGRIYVATQQPDTRLFRLNADGSIDERFIPADTEPSHAVVTRLSADDVGGLFVSGQFSELYGIPSPGAARISEMGGIDLAFAPAFRPDQELIFADGGIYAASAGAEPGLKRLLPSGAVDGSFANIPRARSFLRDREGRFYSLFRLEWHREALVERWNRDGTRDETYAPGRIAIETPTREFGLTPGGRLVISTPYIFANATSLPCENLRAEEYYGIVSLAPPAVNVEVDPRTGWLNEGTEGEIAIFRTGPNHNGPLRVRYQVRDGTARRGIDYSMEPSGTLEFAAGISRVSLPASAIENGSSLLETSFHLDFSEENGAPIGSRAIMIFENDVSLHLLGAGNGLIQAVLAGPFVDIPLFESTDLQTWALRARMTPFTPFEIRTEGEWKFFRAQNPE